MFKTKKETRIAIALLERARKRIESGANGYICDALSVLVEDKKTNSIEFRCAVTIKDYISSALGYNSTYDGWLYNMGIAYWNYDYNKVTQGRLNWIDHMIREIEECSL